MNIENKDELRQRLLELHYDLLEADEAFEMQQAIQANPEVASEWAATLRLAGRFAEAAKFEVAEDAKVTLAKPRKDDGHDAGPPSVVLAHAGDAASESDASGKLAGSRSWWLRSTALATTAAALGMILIGSWYLQRVPNSPRAIVRVQAAPAAPHDAQVDNEFQFVTTRLDGGSSAGGFAVTPATLSFSVLANDSILFAGTTETDRSGSGRIRLPSDLVIPQEAKLKITAKTDVGGLEQSSLEIPLEPTRCLTYLKVDRPVYRPGETVFFRSLTLQRRSLQANNDVPIRFELLDPSGAVVPGAFTEGVTDRGVGSGSFVIPSAAAGGSFKLVAKSLDGFFPDEQCKFQVRAYRVPRFKKKLEFRKRSYGPGETVEADFSAVPAEGGSLDSAKVRVRATVDGKVVYQLTTKTSATGSCMISFALPNLIDQGIGQLSVVVDDGGTQETKTETIPIQLGRVAVEFYPEGGYMVDGLKNRMYFVARDGLGEPIHLEGEIQDRAGQSVATIKTSRDGMGRFAFVPRLGERYTLKVTSPVDVTNSPKLTSAVKDLPVIDTGQGVFAADQPITMSIRSKQAREVYVRAVCRGQLIGEQKVALSEGDSSISLPIRKSVGGVIRVTVLDAKTIPARPLVERLVYRRSTRKLRVEIVDQDSVLQQSPGESLRLTLQVRDESGEPTPAVLGVSVVDDASLSLDDVERPELRTHFLLTSEVEQPEDLEHANFYLNDGADAAESLDLLLGTQGWRRFVSGSQDQPNVDFRQQVIRLLELDGNESLAKKAYDNSGLHASRWLNYRRATSIAWNRLLREARALMLVILLLWLILIAFHLRKQAVAKFASLLLIVSASVILYGCGGSANTIVGSSANEQADLMEYDAMMQESEAASESGSPAGRAEPPRNALGMVAAAIDRMVAPEKSQARYARSEFMEGAAETVAASGQEWMSPRSISKQNLEQLLAARGMDVTALADQLLDELRFPVRQFAHRHPVSQDGVREDFAETLFWHPMLITDSEGRATVRFDLSDSVTSFRLVADGHASDGRIGTGGGEIQSRIPFQIEPKLPLEVTAGDRIDLPIAVINTTESESRVGLSVQTGSVLRAIGESTRELKLAAVERRRTHLSLDVIQGAAEQDAEILIHGTGSGALTDSVRRRIHVSPLGYPERESIAGRLNGQAKIRLPIPKGIVAGSLAVTVRAYPSPLADVMSGVESILREPSGCFEQTSATNYPNTMALLYLRESQTSNPEVSRKAKGMLDRGYTKLTSFECQQRGYEWFGDDPGHEALSAFGLMQFTDMSRVMSINQEMMVRTREWLMGRRDGNGGFQRNSRHLHVWSVEQEIVNAYVLWAITEADVAAGHPRRANRELQAELNQLAKVAQQSQDPYLVALSAATLMNVNRTEEGEKLLEKLAGWQQDGGSLEGRTTVTSSGGISRTMETTAIGILAWVKSPQYIGQARSAAKWISGNRLGNAGFGSTQATVLALKALVAMSGHSQTGAGGELVVKYQGQPLGAGRLPEEARSGQTVEIKGLGEKLQAAVEAEDEIEIELVADGATNLSYTIDVAFHSTAPRSDDACPLELSTKLTGEMLESGSVPAGESLLVETRLANKTSMGQPMTIAIVGLPGGVEPRVEELDELQKADRYDFYEIRGREIVFYWRTIAPNEVKEVDFHVTAAIPGKYTGPASRAYLYYTAEQKMWTAPISVGIKTQP
ncbi:MAG: MG2 domain-containing protein [Rubripirellula sp.]